MKAIAPAYGRSMRKDAKGREGGAKGARRECEGSAKGARREREGSAKGVRREREGSAKRRDKLLKLL